MSTIALVTHRFKKDVLTLGRRAMRARTLLHGFWGPIGVREPQIFWLLIHLRHGLLTPPGPLVSHTGSVASNGKLQVHKREWCFREVFISPAP